MALKPHFSPAKRAGDFIFVSGQLPFDSDMKIVEGDVARQTEVVIEHISRALAGVGAELGDVVKTMVWLSDPADFSRLQCDLCSIFYRGTTCSRNGRFVSYGRGCACRDRSHCA